MTLPEIPDEARAALQELWDSDHAGKFLSREAYIDAWLQAMWGPMYAAALRHAADRGEGVDGGPAYHASRTLRQWADEATP